MAEKDGDPEMPALRMILLKSVFIPAQMPSCNSVAGFDASGKFLLTVSHARRGVFTVGSWERVARDSALAYRGW
jgi:hypothetical protein